MTGFVTVSSVPFCKKEDNMKKRILAMVMALSVAAMLQGCGQSGDAQAEAPAAEAESTEAESTEAESAEAESAEAEAPAEEGQTDSKSEYKVGIVQYVDDASLNQIEANIEKELDAKGEELGVSFDYADYTFNGQADSTVINQIATQLVEDQVDIIIPIATPTAMVMQSATADNQIPVVFSAVTDPVAAGLVASLDAPGANITGTSDALDTKAVLDIMMAVNPQVKKLGLLYDKGQDSSAAAIEEAKSYAQEKGIEIVEKTGTTNDEISLAADALIAEQVDAAFTPTDNTVMTAELGIFEKFQEAKIPQYCGADSFALNGAFLGYGVNYADLGTLTADLAVDILVNGKTPADTPVATLDNGIATINTETAEIIGADYSMVADMCTGLVEVTTAENFDN